MEIYPASPGATSGRNAQAASAQSVITADFQTFLQLLTTQLKNQDPLNPMESTEYATQLATFSGVEQQVRTNELLETLSSGFGTLGLGELGGWIGMEAMAEMPVAFSGAPVRIRADPADRADRTELVVTDASANVVQRIPVPLSDAPFLWTGEDLQGRRLPPGTYTLAVENWSGEDLVETRAATVTATVEEARLSDGRVHLTMQGGVSIPADAVTGLKRGG
ncbi:flagellar hook capping FlgD N-terminal domain-containing protein [Roseibacterium sp. SDUM158017]|uniref:flagellar hook capping FlgD N-terminal domain-containing protein n=1 Tax=Roseicyclus salinarum TaxID=3036773 RepID=UPI0024156D74|nr:flagellar hook capping FlgD N-terminal domain-containing protein [Roseibacterium sp. SDUM158017]MDG4649248.1 flagellar hook capping FlgD N-terminal domain-containing protein [Roseibacterium sp. SDUM158017]